MDIKEFFTGYKGKDMPKELKGFNWGACIFTFIWGLKYKAWITLLALPLIIVQLPTGLNWILLTVLQIYCGIKGNEWAYQVEWWKKPADFRRTQMLWSMTALALTFIIPLTVGLFVVRFVQKSPDNPMEFVRNAQCVTAFHKLEKGLSAVSPNSTPEEMAKSFASKFKSTQLEDNKVIFLSGRDKAKAYYILFDKYSPDKDCSFAENCVVTSFYELPDLSLVPFEPCTFYFDNQKTIVPAENTSEGLKKGNNIFKYL